MNQGCSPVSRNPIVVLALLLSASLAAPWEAGADEKPGDGRTVVLDQDKGSFRAFMRWRTPMMLSADGKLTPLLEPKRGNQEEGRKLLPVLAADAPLRGWAERMTLMSTPWASAPASERLPPEVLRLTTGGRMACSAGQLVGNAEFLVHLGGVGKCVGADLDGCGAEGVGGLQRVAALDAAATGLSAAAVNAEVAPHRPDGRNILLELVLDRVLEEPDAGMTVGALRGQRRLVGFVHSVGDGPASVPTVSGPRLAARPLGVLLGLAPGERRGLSLAGAAGGVEFPMELGDESFQPRDAAVSLSLASLEDLDGALEPAAVGAFGGGRHASKTIGAGRSPLQFNSQGFLDSQGEEGRVAYHARTKSRFCRAPCGGRSR